MASDNKNRDIYHKEVIKVAISNIQHIRNEDLVRNKVDSIKNNQPLFNSKTHAVDEQNFSTKDSSEPINQQIMQDAIAKMNKTIEIFNKRIKLSVHEESKRIVVKIIDSQTDKVVKEVPPKEVLNFIAKLHESLGALIDKKQ